MFPRALHQLWSCCIHHPCVLWRCFLSRKLSTFRSLRTTHPNHHIYNIDIFNIYFVCQMFVIISVFKPKQEISWRILRKWKLLLRGFTTYRIKTIYFGHVETTAINIKWLYCLQIKMFQLKLLTVNVWPVCFTAYSYDKVMTIDDDLPAKAACWVGSHQQMHIYIHNRWHIYIEMS